MSYTVFSMLACSEPSLQCHIRSKRPREGAKKSRDDANEVIVLMKWIRSKITLPLSGRNPLLAATFEKKKTKKVFFVTL